MAKSGDSYKLPKETVEVCKSIFEKIMFNSEEIGKLRLEPYSLGIIERCRAMYKENERLFTEMIKELEK